MSQNQENGKPFHFSLERRFLSGPQSRLKEFQFVVRVMVEFIRGFRTLHFVGPCVSVFGSARFTEGHPYYTLGMEMGARIARMGLTVMTGGGPGIMEAANRGAKMAGGRSVAANIELPHEQAPNPYLDKFVNIKYFFVRKVLLFKYAYAFVVLPGGIGTVDEMYEALTLIQTGKAKNFPVILMGSDYWARMMDQMQVFVRQGAISPQDMDLLIVTDSVDEAAEHIAKYISNNKAIKDLVNKAA